MMTLTNRISLKVYIEGDSLIKTGKNYASEFDSFGLSSGETSKGMENSEDDITR